MVDGRLGFIGMNAQVSRMSPTPSRAVVESFPPQIGACCRVLVLGTAPSVRSLALGQSYAHPQNLFWPFMGELFDAGPDLPYAERVARLHAHGIGIWDVYARCERPGSLDSSIVRASEIANDIPRLAAARPELRAIVLNGGQAQRAFRRLVLPRLSAPVRARVELLDLPSTSPANASIPRARKLQAWRALCDRVRDA